MTGLLAPVDRGALTVRATPQALEKLATALRQARPVTTAAPFDGLAALFETELRLSLERGDADRAFDAAIALWRRTEDLPRCHRTLARVLEGVGHAWAAGECSVRREHRISAAAGAVLTRLRAQRRVGRRPGTVLLAVPPGERHVLALESLAHLLEQDGHDVEVLGELPAQELCDAAAGAARAVVLSVHTPDRRLRALLGALRQAAPRALLAVGGPAAAGAQGADLVTSDVARLSRALTTTGCPLSDREREVLQCVADGLTNEEAALVLGVAVTTLKTHLDRLFDKTGSTRRTAAVAIGLRRGWIS